jgi:hypothetical protein
MNEERKKVLGKIKKCLALSASSNEHEAEAALRQAHALMEKYGIDHADMLAYEAGQEGINAGANKNPSNWETMLANKVADAFGCRLIFAQAGWGSDGICRMRSEWLFVGVDATPEIAGYAFAVLLRQCKRARAAHIETHLRRCKKATKTRRADLFCDGWVSAVAGKIVKFAGNERQQAAIEAFVAKNYPSLRNIQARDRNDGRNISDREWGDVDAGMRSGKNAELNRGVGGSAAPLALE